MMRYFYSFEIRQKSEERTTFEEVPLSVCDKNKKMKKRVADSRQSTPQVTTRTFFFTQKTINISIFVAFRSPDKRTRALDRSERRRRKGREKERGAISSPFLLARQRERERRRRKSHHRHLHHRSSRRNPRSRARKRLNKHHVWNIRVLELRGAENEEGNR
jgi:hypothetical protein